MAEPRGGKETTKRLNGMIAIFEAFARGELRDAPDGTAQSATHSRRKLTEEARLAGRVQQAAEKGGISLAARRLVDGTLADPGNPFQDFARLTIGRLYASNDQHEEALRHFELLLTRTTSPTERAEQLQPLIREIVAGYGDAARRLQRAGLAGAEIDTLGKERHRVGIDAPLLPDEEPRGCDE